MGSFNAGATFQTGVSNDVTADKLGLLITNATPTPGFIQDRTQEAIVATNDTLLIGDASDSNNLKRITVANFTQTLPTANVTTGTIETGTFGTTTSTAATITTGTIPTLVATTLITTGTGTAAAPAIVPTGDANTGIFFPAADTIAFSEGGTESMRIDSSGNVGIGTNNPQNPLHVASSNAIIRLQDTDTVGNGTNPIATWITFRDSANTQTGYFGFPSDPNFYVWNITNSPMLFGTNNQERLRIDSSGNLLVGKTAPSTSTVGFQFTPSDNKIACGAASGASAFFNRNTDDGIIVQIAQDGTVEGSISVSGTTVSYNGGHLSRFSQLPSGQRDPAIKKGTVLSNLDAMCEWRDADGNLLPNEQLNKVKISDVEGDSNTAGVFVNWDNDDQDNPYDLNMAMTGDMIIRIAQGTSVNRGDLLMSAGDGTAKPQGDDIIRSKTIAKVTSTNVTCTYEDGSYCVPCVLMAC
jgi:hypothetical protein